MLYWLLFSAILITIFFFAVYLIRRQSVQSRRGEQDRAEPAWDRMLAEEYEFSGELSPLFPEEPNLDVPSETEARDWQSPPALPRSYAEDRITLLVRDPNWIFAYWELAPEHLAEEESQLMMRLYDLTEGSYDEIHLTPGADNWYIEVGRPSHTFQAELGAKRRTGEFTAIAVSNEVSTPPGAPSELIDGEWACAEELWRRLLGIWTVHPSSLELLERSRRHVYQGTHRIPLRGGRG